MRSSARFDAGCGCVYIGVEVCRYCDMHTAASLFSASTELSADSIESHPRLPYVFAESTYQVDKADDGTPSPAYTRRGCCRIRKAKPLENGKITW